MPTHSSADTEFSWLAKIGQAGAYKHSFGHKPGVTGLVPPNQSVPAHLVLTLDMNDPRLARLGFDVGPWLYLVHPYRYSQGDTFVYRIATDGSGITFIPPLGQLAEPPGEGWPYRDFPEHLDVAPVELVDAPSKMDSFNVDQLYVSSSAPIAQDHNDAHCEAGCKQSKLIKLAVVPTSPIPSLQLWGGAGDGVVAVFRICPSCQAIHTHNDCD